jgi:DNA invertase Pin-like site-specific DNA recombinase
VQHQELSITAYAKRNNLTIDRIIKDEGISAFRKDVSARDGFLEVLDLARKGEVENLIIFETSRISRQFLESQTLIDELTRCNVKIHSVGDNSIINQNELDQLMIAFRSFMNQKASKETGLRVKSAHSKLRAEGKWAAGALPYGFELVNGYAVIRKDLAPEIISLFEDYIFHSSKYVQNKYSIKNRKTLIERISNPMMKQIVGEDLFVRANKVREQRRCAPNSSAIGLNRTEVLFEGLLFHQCCGKKLYLNRDYRSKNHAHIFRCKHCRGNGSTTKKSFSGKRLDKYLEEQVLEILDNLNHDKLAEKFNNRCTKKKLVLELQLKNLKQELSEATNTITKANTKLSMLILSDAEDSVISVITELISNKKNQSAQFQQLISEKETEISQLVESELANELLITNILKAKEIFKSATIPQKKAILQMLIRRIEVSDTNKCDIFLNI